MLAYAKFQDHELLDGKFPKYFNDLHRLHGLPAVCRVVEDAIAAGQTVKSECVKGDSAASSAAGFPEAKSGK